jgi:hypothetical protein
MEMDGKLWVPGCAELSSSVARTVVSRTKKLTNKISSQYLRSDFLKLAATKPLHLSSPAW